MPCICADAHWLTIFSYKCWRLPVVTDLNECWWQHGLGLSDLIKPVAAWGAACVQICKQHCQRPAHPIHGAPVSEGLKRKWASLRYLPVSPTQNKRSHSPESTWFQSLWDQVKWSYWEQGGLGQPADHAPSKRQQYRSTRQNASPSQTWPQLPVCNFEFAHPGKMFCLRIMKTKVTL